MSVSGPCQMCGAATATAQCGRCGSIVCKDHWVAEQGLCTNCAGPGGGRQL
jgi:hypothetical protein